MQAKKGHFVADHRPAIRSSGITWCSRQVEDYKRKIAQRQGEDREGERRVQISGRKSKWCLSVLNEQWIWKSSERKGKLYSILIFWFVCLRWRSGHVENRAKRKNWRGCLWTWRTCLVPWARPLERTFSGKLLQIFYSNHHNVWGKNNLQCHCLE